MTPSDQPESSEDTGSADNSEAVVDAESGAIDIDAIDAINIDEAEVAAAEPAATSPAHPPGSAQRALAWCRQRWAAVLTVAALLVSAATAGTRFLSGRAAFIVRGSKAAGRCVRGSPALETAHECAGGRSLVTTNFAPDCAWSIELRD